MIISSGPANLLVICSADLENRLRTSTFLESYIPEAVISDNSSVYDHRLVLYNSEIMYPEFNFGARESSLTGQINRLISLMDIITVIDYCLEFIRETKSVYCLHGSAVAKDDKGVVFIGAVSGLGKTTAAIHLCYHHGFSFVGDEKILIDQNGCLIGGSKRIIFNKEFLSQSLDPAINNLPLHDLKQKIPICQTSPQLKLLIIPIVSTHSVGVESEKWTEAKTNFHLYEELTRKIRGVSRRIQNFSFPLPSLDTPQLAGYRSDFCRSVSSKIRAHYFKGNLQEVTQTIVNLCNSS